MENKDNIMNNEKSKEIKELIEKVNKSGISSIKEVIVQLVGVINDPKSSAKDLQKIIERDQPLSSKLLKHANSAYYGFRKKISGIQEAIVGIGFNALKELALNQKLCELFQKDDRYDGYSRNTLWKHSVAVALCNKLIYMREFSEIGENVYAAGLLHNIGIIVEDQFLQGKFREALSESEKNNQNLFDAENRIMGFNHAEIGMTMAENWNFPDDLVMAIGCHHDPERADDKFKKITSTLYISDYACQVNNIGYIDAPYMNELLYKKFLNKLKIKEEAIDIIIEDVQEEIENMGKSGWFHDEK